MLPFCFHSAQAAPLKLRIEKTSADAINFDRAVVCFSVERAEGDPLLPEVEDQDTRVKKLNLVKALEGMRTKLLEAARLRFQVEVSSDSSWAAIGSLFTSTWSTAKGRFVGNDRNEEGKGMASFVVGSSGKSRVEVAEKGVFWPTGRQLAVNQFRFLVVGLAAGSNFAVRVKCFAGVGDTLTESGFATVRFVTSASKEADDAAAKARAKEAKARLDVSMETAKAAFKHTKAEQAAQAEADRLRAAEQVRSAREAATATAAALERVGSGGSADEVAALASKGLVSGALLPQELQRLTAMVRAHEEESALAKRALDAATAGSDAKLAEAEAARAAAESRAEAAERERERAVAAVRELQGEMARNAEQMEQLNLQIGELRSNPAAVAAAAEGADEAGAAGEAGEAAEAGQGGDALEELEAQFRACQILGDCMSGASPDRAMEDDLCSSGFSRFNVRFYMTTFSTDGEQLRTLLRKHAELVDEGFADDEVREAQMATSAAVRRESAAGAAAGGDLAEVAAAAVLERLRASVEGVSTRRAQAKLSLDALQASL